MISCGGSIISRRLLCRGGDFGGGDVRRGERFMSVTMFLTHGRRAKPSSVMLGQCSM